MSCPGHLRSSFGVGVYCHIGTICHGQSQEAVFIILLQQTNVFLLLLAQSVFHYLQLNRCLPCTAGNLAEASHKTKWQAQLASCMISVHTVVCLMLTARVAGFMNVHIAHGNTRQDNVDTAGSLEM